MSAMDQFDGAAFVSVRTFKRNGDPVDTPVWPITIEGTLYFGSPAHTHKVRRLRAGSAVEVAHCDSRGRVTGKWVPGTAHLLEVDEFRPIKRALDAERRFSAPLIGILARLRRWEYVGVAVAERDDG